MLLDLVGQLGLVPSAILAGFGLRCGFLAADAVLKILREGLSALFWFALAFLTVISPRLGCRALRTFGVEL